MTVTQIYSLVNAATNEAIGATAVVNEDLSNLVDVGAAVFDGEAVDKYVKALVNHVGKMVFAIRKYDGSVPSLMYDDWEYGSVVEKIRTGLPAATENESWSLENGQSYDPNVFYKPSVSVKFFNSLRTFEVPVSITELQVKQSFSNASQMNGFIEMIFTSIENTMTLKTDEMIMRTINNFIGETFYDEFPLGVYTTSSVKAINLLYLYNQRYGTSLTAAAAVTTPEFLKFAAYTMGLVASRMSKYSTLFNIGEKPTFTPKDQMRCVMLADFSQALNPYLKSVTYHDELIALPAAETVPFWQGSGTSYAFSDTSSINIKLASDDDVTVSASGILAVLFDRWACGVNNTNKRVKTHEVVKAEFFNYWYKQDCNYFNDLDENFVVFYVA